MPLLNHLFPPAPHSLHLNHISTQCLGSSGIAHLSCLRTFECASSQPGGSLLFPSPLKTHPCPVLCMIRFVSSSRLASTILLYIISLPHHHTICFPPENASTVAMICCVLLCKLSLLTRLKVPWEQRYYTLSYTWSTIAVSRQIVVE